MTTNTHPTLEAGTIVEFPDRTRGWVHLEEWNGMVCCYRAADLDDAWNAMALYTPDALLVLYPPPFEYNEGHGAFEVQSEVMPLVQPIRLEVLLGIMHIACRDADRPGYWLLRPTSYQIEID